MLPHPTLGPFWKSHQNDWMSQWSLQTRHGIYRVSRYNKDNNSLSFVTGNHGGTESIFPDNGHSDEEINRMITNHHNKMEQAHQRRNA